MQLVLNSGGEEHDIDVMADASDTLGSLIGLALPRSETTEVVFVDGEARRASDRLDDAGLAAGAEIALQRTGSRCGVVDLCVVGGPASGTSVSLPPGRHVLGSSSTVTIRLRTAGVAPQHLWLDVAADATVRVAQSPTGPSRRIGPTDLLEVGGNVLAVREPSALRPLRTIPARRGTVAFNRPPRLVEAEPAPTVVLPEQPRPPAPRARMGIAALLVPVLFGITLAIVIHPRMALFALLGPIMMFASWLDDKRRSRKFRRTSAADIAVAAEALTARLAAERTAESLRRRHTQPTVAAIASIAQGGLGMWERRPAHADFMRLTVGYGRPRWLPRLDRSPDAAPPEIRATLERHGRLALCPLTVGLQGGQTLGVAGAREHALATVRSLVAQAAALHGPSDLRVAVVTDHPLDWGWVKWLPHTVVDGSAGRRLLACETEERTGLVAQLASVGPGGERAGGPMSGRAASPAMPLTLLVVDVETLAAPELAGLRHLLGGRGLPVAGLVIARSRSELPSVCTVVSEVAAGAVRIGGAGRDTGMAAAAGLPEREARRIARSLTRYDDPDRIEPGAELPSSVRLRDLLGERPPAPESIRARWERSARRSSIAAPIGVTETGNLWIDLVADGPHALLAGTTGSGKSELLRTLVASLAVTADPNRLTFVLIDYKGGSAFDACADLPHTVGMVTDLDDRLAERALGCLEAELRHRERRLRDAGADDLPAYLAMGPDEPLPRMLIAIDEFAALAKELPDFMDALVDIAARGRSLGVHLLLATQRPAGVIRDNVRANTNLRIALRVQDRTDSVDVLDDPGAAAIARSQPGRGFVRLGPGEVVPFQAALVTGVHRTGADRTGPMVRRFRFASEQDPFETPSPDVASDDDAATDLDVLVAATIEAARRAGIRPPRRPWPDPLPRAITLDDLAKDGAPGRWSVPLGLVDEPDHQRRSTMWWSPEDGSLAVFGLTGSGGTSTLATIALALAGTADPDELHLYAFDFDAGGLAPLGGLPHVGAVVGAGERDRQLRLVRRLSEEVERRKVDGGMRGRGGGWSRIVVFVDNFAGFSAAFDAAADTPVRDALHRVITEGPSVGVVSVVSGTRPNAVPLAVLSTIPNKLVLRLADPLAAATLGLRAIPSDLPNGRAIDVGTKRDVQIALAGRDGIEAAVERFGGGGPARVNGGPFTIEQLPTEVKIPAVVDGLVLTEHEWFLPVGIGDTFLEPVGFPLGAGDHVLVAGEPRSGRTTTLCAIGEMMSQCCPDVTLTAVALRRSALREVAGIARLVTDPDALADTLTPLVGAPGPQLVLIDDADAVDDPGVLAELAATRRPDLHVIAAGRRDLKTVYNHWAKALCRSRLGLWLRPSPGLDGDLWSTPMPRHVPAGMPPGRGYLIGGGAVELVQAARP